MCIRVGHLSLGQVVRSKNDQYKFIIIDKLTLNVKQYFSKFQTQASVHIVRPVKLYMCRCPVPTSVVICPPKVTHVPAQIK